MAHYVDIFGPIPNTETLQAVAVCDGKAFEFYGPDDDLVDSLRDAATEIVGNRDAKDMLRVLLHGMSYYRLDGPKYMQGNAAVAAGKLRKRPTS